LSRGGGCGGVKGAFLKGERTQRRWDERIGLLESRKGGYSLQIAVRNIKQDFRRKPNLRGGSVILARRHPRLTSIFYHKRRTGEKEKLCETGAYRGKVEKTRGEKGRWVGEGLRGAYERVTARGRGN